MQEFFLFVFFSTQIVLFIIINSNVIAKPPVTSSQQHLISEIIHQNKQKAGGKTVWKRRGDGAECKTNEIVLIRSTTVAWQKTAGFADFKEYLRRWVRR